MHRRTTSLLAAAMVAIMLAGPALAQDPTETYVDQPLKVDEDLVVEPGRTLTLGPNAEATGDGRIIVRGTLRVAGTADERVPISVPIQLEDGGTIDATGADVHDVRAVAILVLGGTLDLKESTFRENRMGVSIHSSARDVSVRIADTHFLDHESTGMNAYAPADVLITDSTFERNHQGFVAHVSDYDLTLIRMVRTDFIENEHHVILSADPHMTKPSVVSIEGSTLRDTYAPGEQADPGPAVAIHGGLPNGDHPTSFAFHSKDNVYLRNAQGIDLGADSVPVFSLNDTFRGNDAGIKARAGTVIVEAGTFLENEYDVEAFAQGNVILRNSTYDPTAVRGTRTANLEVDGSPIALTRGKIAAAGGVAALLGAIAIAFTDAGRRLILFPMYSRLGTTQVLAHEKRKAVLEYVTDNPGVHMRRIGKETGISYSTLTYHVHRLEKEGYITAEEEGLFKRYYLTAGRMKNTLKGAPVLTSLRPTERSIYDAIAAAPGSAQSQIADRLGITRQALHYHIKKLEKGGYIRKVTRGRETLCYPEQVADENGVLTAAGGEAASS